MAPFSTFSAKLLPTAHKLRADCLQVKGNVKTRADRAAILQRIVKELLAVEGQSQRKLADAAGVSKGVIENIKAGKTPQESKLDALESWARQKGLWPPDEEDGVDVPTRAELLRIREMLGEITAIVDRYVPGKGSRVPTGDAIYPPTGEATDALPPPDELDQSDEA